MPSDAPVILHGIETGRGRPVDGLAYRLLREPGQEAMRLRRVAGDPDPAATDERHVEQLFRHSPAVGRGPRRP